MNIGEFSQKLNTHVTAHKPNFGDDESVLTLLYEAYSDCNMMNDGKLKEDFNELYRLMNGMTLQEMDKIIYPVCTLCRDHQRSGFVDGVKVGMLLANEIGKSGNGV